MSLPVRKSLNPGNDPSLCRCGSGGRCSFPINRSIRTHSSRCRPRRIPGDRCTAFAAPLSIDAPFPRRDRWYGHGRSFPVPIQRCAAAYDWLLPYRTGQVRGLRGADGPAGAMRRQERFRCAPSADTGPIVHGSGMHASVSADHWRTRPPYRSAHGSSCRGTGPPDLPNDIEVRMCSWVLLSIPPPPYYRPAEGYRERMFCHVRMMSS